MNKTLVADSDLAELADLQLNMFFTNEIEHDASDARRDDYYCEIP
jgi:hypothetical protein